MFADYAKLFMVSNKLQEPGTSGFANYILGIGFVDAKTNTSLFIYRRGNDTAYLLFYVDDIVLTTSSEILKTQFIDLL